MLRYTSTPMRAFALVSASVALLASSVKRVRLCWAASGSICSKGTASTALMTHVLSLLTNVNPPLTKNFSFLTLSSFTVINPGLISVTEGWERFITV